MEDGRLNFIVAMSVAILGLLMVTFSLIYVIYEGVKPEVQCWKPTFVEQEHTWHPITCPKTIKETVNEKI